MSGFIKQPSARLIDTGLFMATGNVPAQHIADEAARLVMSGAFQLKDTDAAYFLAQQLENIQAEVLPVLYGDLKFRELFPVDTSTPAGASYYGYKTKDYAGQAKIINTASKDIPWSSVSRGKVLRQADWLATKYGYSYGEIQAAAYSGEPLDADNVESARRAIEELLDTLVWDGDTAAGITGIFNNTDIVTATVPAGVSTTTPWTTKTADEIIADINKLFTDPFVLSKEKERLNTVLLPTAQWTYIANTRVGDTTVSILNYIVLGSPWITSADQIKSVPLLDGKGTSGADVMIGYTKDPSKIQAKILQDVTFHPVQQRDLNFEVIVTAKSGGVKLPYPISFYILEGI